MKNPYANWKDNQQCFFTYAQDKDKVYTHTNATRWCAVGILIRENIPLHIEIKFKRWMVSQYNHPLIYLNDILRWKPSQFEAAWDEFMKEENHVDSI